MLQRDMGLTPFIAMMDTLGLDSSIRDSFVQGSTEFCFTMQTFEQSFSVLAVCYNQLGIFKKKCQGFAPHFIDSDLIGLGYSLGTGMF